MTNAGPSEKLRIAATLLHAIPGLGLELDDGQDPAGEAARPFSPCDLRNAIGQVMGSVPQDQHSVDSDLCDLVRSRNLSVQVMPRHSKVFAGDVVGFVCCTTAVFAFATTSTPAEVRQGSFGKPRLHTLQTVVDDVLETTIAFVEVDIHHRLELGWQDRAVEELHDVLVGCLRVSVEQYAGSPRATR